MEGWFELAMPWWHFVARAAVAYLGLLLLMRVAGKHAFGELSPFEILVLVTVGGTLRSAMLGQDHSLLGPFICIVTMLTLDKLIAWCTANSARVNDFVTGRPVVIASRGRVDHRALLRHTVAPDDFERAMREHGIASAASIEEARLEPNGKITFLTRHGRQE